MLRASSLKGIVYENMRINQNRGATLGCLAALLLGLPPIAMAQQIAIGGYPVTGEAFGITPGPDSALWFTESNSSKIGRLTTAGALTEFPLPNAASDPTGITAGPDGALWFTENAVIGVGNKIGRITTSGAITEYDLSTFTSVGPFGITAGSDGALWFTEVQGNRIGRITTSGAVTQYPVPTAGSQPQAIALGSDGALWFTETAAGKIGRITTAGAITEYSTAPEGAPTGITAGPDGALWFGGSSGIGQITTTGVVTEYNSASATQITAGPDGALWFTSFGQIGRITTAGVSTYYQIPGANTDPRGITTGPDGELWFAERMGRHVGEAVFVTAGMTAAPATGAYGTALTFSGSAFLPNENVSIYLSGVGSRVLAHATANSIGSFTVSAAEPQSPNGPRLFLAVGQTSGKLGAASFSVVPALILQPKLGGVGTAVTVEGYGFAAYATVKIYWNNSTMLLGSVNANDAGTFNNSNAFSFTVPSGSTLGPNRVIAIQHTAGGPVSAQAAFTVQ